MVWHPITLPKTTGGVWSSIMHQKRCLSTISLSSMNHHRSYRTLTSCSPELLQIVARCLQSVPVRVFHLWSTWQSRTWRSMRPTSPRCGHQPSCTTPPCQTVEVRAFYYHISFDLPFSVHFYLYNTCVAHPWVMALYSQSRDEGSTFSI